MTARRPRILRRPALWLGQNDRYPIYLTSLTGEELLAVADISRLSRTDAGKLLGYQRPEVRRHIRDITEYSDHRKYSVDTILKFGDVIGQSPQ